MKKTLAEIAELIDGVVVGDANLIITGINGIQEAKEGDLTFVENPKYFSLIARTKASAIITPKDFDVQDKSIIRANNPSIAFSKIVSLIIEKEPHFYTGIHKTALIEKNVVLGKNVSIGPYCVIEGDVKIDDNSIIYGGCYIGHNTVIGKDCLIYSNVTIREKINLGNKVIIHSGTVIGSDGFGYALVNGVHEKIPQLGTVLIEDNVEIGANVTVDRARFDKTIIGKGTKIDNLVQIAHNVVIGQNCIICAQVGISGSTIIGNGVILAGQAGLAGHLSIGDGAIVAAQGGVTKSIAAKQMVSGYPAQPHQEAKKINAHVQRLPFYIKTLKELKLKIDEIEKKINKTRKQ